MQTGTLNEFKKELLIMQPFELTEICLRLAKHKKENKELLNYLLFGSREKALYILEIKEEMDASFKALHPERNFYRSLKSLRKILRFVNLQARYIGEKADHADLLLHFCRRLTEMNPSVKNNMRFEEFFVKQTDKIRKLIEKLHEDLQFDSLRELEEIEKGL